MRLTFEESHSVRVDVETGFAVLFIEERTFDVSFDRRRLCGVSFAGEIDKAFVTTRACGNNPFSVNLIPLLST